MDAKWTKITGNESGYLGRNEVDFNTVSPDNFCGCAPVVTTENWSLWCNAVTDEREYRLTRTEGVAGFQSHVEYVTFTAPSAVIAV